jgi:hypothetical protein
VSLAVFAATCVPILLVTYPPLLDYPNHLARVHVVGHLADRPAFAALYRADWRLYPNLAIDLIGPVLERLVGIAAAGKLFLLGIAALQQGGAHVLGRELHGRPTWLAPLAGFFFYTMYFLYGFANYLFGVGLFLFAFTAWLRADRTGRPAWLVLAQIAAVACYVAHAMSYACLAIAAVVWSVVHRRARLALATLLPPLALHFAFNTTPVGTLVWDDLGGKLNAIIMLFATYDRAVDVAIGVVFLGALGLGLRRLQSPALAIALAFFAAFAVAPAIGGTTWAFDRRFVLPCALLVLLAIELGPRARLALVLATAATFARIAFVAWSWVGLGARLEAGVALMDRLPPGSRVAGFAFLHREDKVNWTRSIAFGHAVHWGAVRRDLATWRLFTAEEQQPLRANPLPAPIRHVPSEGQPAAAVDWPALFADFDAVWGFRFDPDHVAYLRAHCATVDTAGLVLLARGCHAP